MNCSLKALKRCNVKTLKRAGKARLDEEGKRSPQHPRRNGTSCTMERTNSNNAQLLHSGYSARDCIPGWEGAHWRMRPKDKGCHAGFSVVAARMSPLVGRKGRRWNLLKASFNLFLFGFSFISVSQTPKNALLFQLI